MGMLDGQVAIVTASAGAGIGQATARRFAEEGAQVVISDAHGRRAQETAEALGQELGREFLALEADVTDAGHVNRMVEQTLDRHGRIDILVNNAARNILAPVREMPDETWHTVLDVCLNGTFYCTRAVLPHMLERRSGAIVNLASVIGWEAAVDQAAYATAKAGIMAFTRAVAAEVAHEGIRVNAVAPSFAPNPFLERVYTEEQLEAFRQHQLLGRGAGPREIANVILFLVSDLSTYMTGEVLSVSNQHP